MTSQIDEYLALEPPAFPYLTRLELSQQGPDVSMAMTFAGDTSARLVVRCDGVRDLALRQPFASEMKLISLDVQDLRSSQLEGVRFKVQDIEQEWLAFLCRTFAAERRDALV